MGKKYVPPPITPLDFDPFQGDDGEERTLVDAMVKARKSHECTHCGTQIAVGELHRSRRGVVDGDLMSWRWCALCCAAMVTVQNFYENGDEDSDHEEEMAYERRYVPLEKRTAPVVSEGSGNG